MSRKSLLIVRLVVLLLLLLALLPIAARMLFAGGRGFFGFGNSLLPSEPVFSDSFTGVQSVEVDVVSVAVEVEEQDGGATTVEYFTSGGDSETVEASMSGGVLYIRQPRQFGFFDLSGIASRVVIRVPRGSALDYAISTTSGSVRLAAGSGSTAVTTTSGSIKIWGAGRQVSALSVSGSVKIYDPFEEISASTTSGSIKATAGETTRSAALCSTSGSVKLRMPEGSGYTLLYQSTSGSVRDEYRNIKFGDDGRYVHGDGAMQLNLQTTSGSIKLCDWTAD